jgi:YVTN family beta-propeller protein
MGFKSGGRYSVSIDIASHSVINTISAPGNDSDLYTSISSTGNYVWLSNYRDDSVYQIDKASHSIIRTIGVGNGPFGLSSDGRYVWVANYDDNTVSQIDIATHSVINTIPVGFHPTAISSDGIYVWVTFEESSLVYQIQIAPSSDICFPAGTPVQTDQGLIAIDKLQIDVHTINTKPIIDVTKTVSTDPYLICFEKDALALNRPTQKTILSKNHKISHQGQMLPADAFVGHYSENVTRINYKGEYLYNVLLSDHSTMMVNNLTCETLDPNAIYTKLYTKLCKFTAAERDKMVTQLMNCKDRESHAKLVSQL